MKNHLFAFNSVIAPDFDNPGLEVSGSGNAGIGIFILAGDDLQEGRQMLANMMDALKFDLATDACIIICPENGGPVNLPYAIRKFHLKTLLFFGVKPEVTGIRFPLPIHGTVAHQGIVYLLTHTLSELIAEKARGGKAMRGTLWSCLKQIFE